jgi:hypothetical protein
VLVIKEKAGSKWDVKVRWQVHGSKKEKAQQWVHGCKADRDADWVKQSNGVKQKGLR